MPTLAPGRHAAPILPPSSTDTASTRRRTGALTEDPRDPSPVRRLLASAASHPLTREQEIAVGMEFLATGDPAAANRLVTANLRFLYGLAATGYRDGANLDLDDLFHELIAVAYDRLPFYKPAQATFMTYIEAWAKLTVAKAYAKLGRPVAIPVERVTHERQLFAAEARLRAQTERTPTDAELCTALGWGADTLRSVRSAGAEGVSLQGFSGDAEGPALADRLADAPAVCPTAVAPALLVARKQLSAREWVTMALTLGLDGSPGCSLEKAAELVPRARTDEERAAGFIPAHQPLTREAVRRLKENALLRLREAPDMAACDEEDPDD